MSDQILTRPRDQWAIETCWNFLPSLLRRSDGDLGFHTKRENHGRLAWRIVLHFVRLLRNSKTISNKAKDYGICRIIPLEGWRMPFVTDTEVCGVFTRGVTQIQHFSFGVFDSRLAYNDSTQSKLPHAPSSTSWSSCIGSETRS